MTKRVLALLCAAILIAALIPASLAQGEKRVSLHFEPTADWQGIDIKLDALLDFLADDEGLGEAWTNTGFYEFAFTVKALEDGGVWKILTQNGTTPPAYARYTLLASHNGTFTLKTTTRGDTPDQGPIPAAEIRAAADAGQMMRFSQQGTSVPFIIDEITVVRIDEEGDRTWVYRMSLDISALNDGDDFEGTNFLQKAGSFPITAIVSTEETSESPEPTETTHPSETPHPSETTHPSETPHPSETTHPSETPHPSETHHPSEGPHPSEGVLAAEHNPKTGDAFPAVMAVTLLLASVAAVFALTRRKPSKQK